MIGASGSGKRTFMNTMLAKLKTDGFKIYAWPFRCNTRPHWHCPVCDGVIRIGTSDFYEHVLRHGVWLGKYPEPKICNGIKVNDIMDVEAAKQRCFHCLITYPPVSGGSDVCDCPCHKSSYFRRIIGWIPPVRLICKNCGNKIRPNPNPTWFRRFPYVHINGAWNCAIFDTPSSSPLTDKHAEIQEMTGDDT